MADAETELRELEATLDQARQELSGLGSATSAVDSAEDLLRELNGRTNGL